MDEPSQGIKRCLIKTINISIIWDWQAWHTQAQQAVFYALLRFLWHSIGRETPPTATTSLNPAGSGRQRLANTGWLVSSDKGRPHEVFLHPLGWSGGDWFQPRRPVECPHSTPSVASLAPKLVLRSRQLKTKKLGLPVHLSSPLMSEVETVGALLPTETKC